MTNARPPQGHLEWCGLCDDEVRIRTPLAQTTPALRGRGMRIATPSCGMVRNDRLDGLLAPNYLADDPSVSLTLDTSPTPFVTS